MRTNLNIELDENTRTVVRETGEMSMDGPVMAVDFTRTMAVDDWFDSIGQKLTLEMTRLEMIELCDKMMAAVEASLAAEKRHEEMAAGHG